MAIRDILKHPEGPSKISQSLARHIRDTEIRSTVAVSTLSSLRHHHDSGVFLKFNWLELWQEMRSTFPTLTTSVLHLIPESKRTEHIPAACLICGMIMKAKNQQMNVVQDMLSILLYGGHTTTMVSYAHSCSDGKLQLHIKLLLLQTMEMLQPMLLTVSRKTLSRLIDTLASNHDQDVVEWVKDLLHKLQTSDQVRAYVS